MILSDRDIKARLALPAKDDRQLYIDDPVLPIQPASIDVRLGPILKSITTGTIWNLETWDDFHLGQGEFLLGATLERIGIPPDLVGVLDGKSTLGREGLLVHCTAGYIDPGFRGTVTLELKNLGPEPILLEAGMLIGQLRLHVLSSRCERPYGSAGLGSHYQDQIEPMRSHRRG